jgi:hypothetical protein
VEQVADSHIVWKSTGAKGHVDGAVTFTSLGANLTRVLLVMEYYPQGLFERTGNIWRAQGRRARLDLKNFARFITLKGEAEDGWRGEIEDGEVVKSHEDAVAEEEESEESEGAEGAEDSADTEEEEEEQDGPYAEDETEEEPEEEGEPEDEYEEYDEEEPEEEAEGEAPAAEEDVPEEEEEEYEHAEGGSRR